jgi:YidC/Oxa1 family membrane protein insertase
MDKKNTVIGVLLLVAAVASFVISNKYAPTPPRPAITTTSSGSPLAQNEAPASGPAHSVADAAFTAPEKSTAPADYLTLQNEYVTVKFTTAGGAIDSVELRQKAARLDAKGKESKDRYTLNAQQAAPALSLLNFPGLDQDARYTLVSQTANEVVYHTVLDGKLEVTRHYTLLSGANGDPYQIRHETTFHNLTDQALPLRKLAVSVGTAVPLNENDSGIYLNVGYYNGDKTAFTRRDELAGGGFFTQTPPLPFMEKTITRQDKNPQGAEVTVPAMQWVTVKNQFFATILTPDQPGGSIRIERVKLDLLAPAETRSAYGVTAAAQFELAPLAAGASTVWGATYFAGPKEYSRLAKAANFKHNEDLVMDFGFFGWFSKLLLTIMTWIHGVVVHVSPVWAWGWSIILTTLILKLVFVPFTLAASRSSKRMQKIMPLVTASKEKYKDNPAKAQEAMMKIYKENKVNPVGGCVPILITIPFFIGFFSMLQSTAELRFAPFLWAKDLASPDTILSFGTTTLPILGLVHLSINILPLLMGATMLYQMKVTPTPTADPAQATMMKFMPIMMIFFFYSYASALALYSTVNGLFTIAQQMVINKMPEHQLPTAPAAAGGIKNVTPKKKG